MPERGFTEKDWKLFRNKISDWQEAYMDKLNKEYIELLSEGAIDFEDFEEFSAELKEVVRFYIDR